jgi:hypothetical protein
MRPPLSRFTTTIVVVALLVAACASAPSPAPVTTPPPPSGPPVSPSTVDVDFGTAPSGSEPTGTPTSRVDHATGPTDVVLRFDDGGVDYGICELCGGWGPFTPGPEFTLYGDGAVIVRNELAQPPPAEGPIHRAQPFTIAHLNDDQIQALLRLALGEGGLETARERYETSTDTDDPGYSVFTIRAGGLDKRVEIFGSNSPFESLADHLRGFGGGGNLSTQIWVPDRYWGLLIEVSSWIEHGVLPDPGDAAVVPWPWPEIVPEDFAGLAELGRGNPHRVMSPDEAAVLGLSDDGGVATIYLVGPDGETIYSFSLWPMLPDETG